MDMMTEIAEEATTEEKEDPDLQETTNASIAEKEDTGQTNAESLTIRLMPNAQVNVLNVANKATFKRIVLSVVLHQKWEERKEKKEEEDQIEIEEYLEEEAEVEAALKVIVNQGVEAIPKTEETKNKGKRVIALLLTLDHLQKAKVLPVLNLRNLLKANIAKDQRVYQKNMKTKKKFQKNKNERLILTWFLLVIKLIIMWKTQ